MVLWDKIFLEITKEYPDVETDKMLVDAMTVRMVLQPQSLDTIVATNLHADILSDLAAALSGSIGIAPSSNLDPTRENPSMFEPIHGSAPDIAGKGIANPIGAFWSAAEMVRWLGFEETAFYPSTHSFGNCETPGITLVPPFTVLCGISSIFPHRTIPIALPSIKLFDIGPRSLLS